MEVEKADEVSGSFLPDGYPELMVFNSPATITLGDEKCMVTAQSILGSQSTVGGYINFQSPLKLIGLKFQPWIINHFLKPSIQELTNCFAKAEHVLKLNVKYLEDHLANTIQDPTHVFRWFNEELSRLGTVKESNAVKNSLDLIIETQGRVSAHYLGEVFGQSQRSFEMAFKSSIGLSAKKYCRIIRVRRLAEAFRKEQKSLTEMAYDFGYFDQSHFIHDFKKVALSSPRNFFSKDNLVLSRP